MIIDIKSRIVRHENKRRHAQALEQGLSVSITSQMLIADMDTRRITDEGQNAADEIGKRILAETGTDPCIRVRYLSPSHDVHDMAWLGM